jgi:hypothetical protein
MATHGRGGLARLVLGSVATGTLRRAAAPLLLVRPAAMRRPVEAPELTQASVTAAMEPPEPTAPTVNVPLTGPDLELIERGLSALMYLPEFDYHLAANVRALLTRLEQTELAGASGEPAGTRR